MSEPTVNIEEFLRGEGFDSDEALHEARVVLERHKLTNARKQAFVAAKLPRARALLASSLLRACDGCRPQAPAGRPVWVADGRRRVAVGPQHCEICSGSNNRRAAARCIDALRRRGIQHLLVVGGTPVQQHDLKGLLADATVEVRFVDGTQASHSTKQAELNKRWAELVVVWAPTPLRHSVSDKYTEDPYAGLKVVSVPRRGIEALCDEVVRALR